MTPRLLSAAIVLAASTLALAQDAKILSGRDSDDLQFSRELVRKGYPDLAKSLLEVLKKARPSSSNEVTAAIKAIELYLDFDKAKAVEDPLKRTEAMTKVIGDMEKFIDEAKGTPDAEDLRVTLPEFFNVLGEAYTTAIKKADEKTAGELRSKGDAFFSKYEEVLKKRIAELKEIDPKTTEVEYQLMAARYNYPHQLYFHSLLFPAGSSKRQEFCTTAIDEYGEFDLDYNGELLNFYAYVDTGLCFKELGKPDDAIANFDLTVAIRETYGEKVKGVWPMPPDIVDLVCYAMVQKVNLYVEQKQPAKVVEVGKDYFTSTPQPFEAGLSMVLAQKYAEAQDATGDRKGMVETANRMIEVDPNGIGGLWGRELLERSGGTPWPDRLKNAEAKIAGNNLQDLERGLTAARDVIYDAIGTPDEAEAGCDALVLVGYAYHRRGMFEEAALAYQTAVDKYPKAKSAPEALYRAIDCYQGANRAGRRKFYTTRIDAAMSRFVRDYPTDHRAGSLQILKAEGMMGDGDFLGAIEIFKLVSPQANEYTKALLLMGISYFNHTLKLKGDNKAEEAKTFYPLAEKAFQDTSKAIDKRRGETMDTKILAALEEQDFIARISLARLYMLTEYSKPALAKGAIDALEQKWASDSKKGPEIQNLRGRLFLDEAKFDEAEKWINDLSKSGPKAAASPAGQLARALDQQGLDIRTAKPGSAEADDLWRRAARYYWISISPQVKGEMTQNAGEMTDVGNRFFAYGLHFNQVPADRMTWVDWTATDKKAADYWTKAAEIYEAALAQTPDYRMTINLGRTYGFLGRHADAARIYQKLFEQEQVVNPKNPKRLDTTVIGAKSELIAAYLEYGVAERLAALATGDKERQSRAQNIFPPLLSTLTVDKSGQIWWPAKYHQVRTLMDRGLYVDANLAIEDVQRNVSKTFDDNKYGYAKLFEATIEELKTKLPSK